MGIGLIKENSLHVGDARDVLKKIKDNKIDLTITSPPYDNLREYNGFHFDYRPIARELYRITKNGGVVVWIVNDQKVNGSKTGTSFKQALYFKEMGFYIHDVMIWRKTCVLGAFTYTYYPIFDYMFIFSKGRPKTFNPILDRKNSAAYNPQAQKSRQKDGCFKGSKKIKYPREYGKRFNIWDVKSNYWNTSRDKIAYEHPAIFPEDLIKDHILSWSNKGDIVLDPMIGSGTTAKMSFMTGRRFIGVDISKEYIDLSIKRLAENGISASN